MNLANLGLDGAYQIKHIRNGKELASFDSPNIVVNEGLIHTLNSVVSAQPQITNWYLGLFSANYTPVATDTAANIAANATEVNAQYSEATRPAFVALTTNAVTVENAPVSFTFTAPVNVYGGFLVSASGKGATSGKLLSASKFPTVRNILAGDVFQVSYKLTISDV
jgi:hypothetical protein